MEGSGEIEDNFFPADYEDEEIRAIRKKYPVPRNTWIVKPGENSNRGFGIAVAHHMPEIRNLVTKTAHRDATGNGVAEGPTTVIIQKYIDNPFLIHKRKFDLRLYGLATCINKKLKGFFF